MRITSCVVIINAKSNANTMTYNVFTWINTKMVQDSAMLDISESELYPMCTTE